MSLLGLSLMIICLVLRYFFFFVMIRRPPRSTRTDTLFPYTTLFRSGIGIVGVEDRTSESRSSGVAWKPSPGVWRAIEAAISARSEEHTSELQSLMRISYAVFCLKKKKKNNKTECRMQAKQAETEKHEKKV